MLNDITIVKCEVMSHLVRLRGKDTVQCAHCALYQVRYQVGAEPVTRVKPTKDFNWLAELGWVELSAKWAIQFQTSFQFHLLNQALRVDQAMSCADECVCCLLASF